MKKIKFIHCADLHLDSPFVGLSTLPESIYEKTKKSTFTSFTKIVDVAIEEKVDFVIIAGDIYDGEDRSIRAQLYFRREMERLEKENIPVYLIHGNHDHLGGSWTNITLPNNVHIFPAQVEMIPFTKESGERVHLYGFSYPKKHVFEREIMNYKKISGADFHIGLLHGHDSNDQNHYSYAPFSLQELLEKDFDYWALGHIHKREILHEHPYIVYPGNIQGRHHKEQGEKGCYLVEMDEMETELTFIPTAPILFQSARIEDCGPLRTFEDVFQVFTNIKNEWRKKNVDVFLEVSIQDGLLDENVQSYISSGELLSLLQEGEEQQNPFVLIDTIKVDKKRAVLEAVNDDFYNVLHNELKQADLQEALASLFNNPRAKKHLDSLTRNEELHIKEEANHLLYELLKGTGGE